MSPVRPARAVTLGRLPQCEQEHHDHGGQAHAGGRQGAAEADGSDEGEYQPRGRRRHQRSHGVVGEQQPAHREFDDPRAQCRHDKEARLDAEHRRDIGRARGWLGENQHLGVLPSLPADHPAHREDDGDARLPRGRQNRPLKTHHWLLPIGGVLDRRDGVLDWSGLVLSDGVCLVVLGLFGPRGLRPM